MIGIVWPLRLSLVATASLLAACGGDDGGGPSSTRPSPAAGAALASADGPSA